MSIKIIGASIPVIDTITEAAADYPLIFGSKYASSVTSLTGRDICRRGAKIGAAVARKNGDETVKNIIVTLSEPAETIFTPGPNEAQPAEAHINFIDLSDPTEQVTSITQEIKWSSWEAIINNQSVGSGSNPPSLATLEASTSYYRKSQTTEIYAAAIRIKHPGEDYSTYCIVFGSEIWSEDNQGTSTVSHKGGADNYYAAIYFSPTNFNDTYGHDFYIEDVIEPDEQNDFPDPIDPTGYIGGSGDDTSDTIPIPDMPTVGVTNIGFVNVYKPTVGALQGLGNTIFPAPTTPTSVMEAIQTLTDTMSSGRLIDYVIDCHIIPVVPTTGANEYIKVGYKSSDVQALKVTSDYVDIDCGSLNIPEYFSSFADYMSHGSLFLPFVGYVDVKPEYWQAGTIKVVYRLNVLDGSFMCFVLSTSSKSQLTNSVISQYSGSCCVHIPITGLNYSSMVSGLVSAAAGVVSGASPIGAANSVLQTMMSGPEPQKSNSYNSSGSFLSMRYPYLLIERPVSAWSANHRHDKGLPLEYTTTIGSLSGFTQIEDIDLSDLLATQEEKETLKDILASGFYI